MKEHKVCIICKKRFSRIDHPRSFDRMVTCGDVKCAGLRSYALWRKRYDSWKSPSNLSGIHGNKTVLNSAIKDFVSEFR
jgi:hypothetical protein